MAGATSSMASSGPTFGLGGPTVGTTIANNPYNTVPNGIDIVTYTPDSSLNPFTRAYMTRVYFAIQKPAHLITQHLMPITFADALTGQPVITNQFITMFARVADGRPPGAPANTITTRVDEVSTRLKRYGLGTSLSADALLTAEGVADALVKRKAVADSVANTTLVVALKALLLQPKDAARFLKMYLSDDQRRDVQAESSRMYSEMAGMLNRRTGGVAILVESFNFMFRFYNGKTRFLLMAPETAAMLAVRSESREAPRTAIDNEHTRMYLQNSPDVQIIACPPLPYDSSGELVQALARPVYASSFVFVPPTAGKESSAGAPDNCITGVRVFDGVHNEFPVLAVGTLMQADPTLRATATELNFTNSPYGYGDADELMALYNETKNSWGSWWTDVLRTTSSGYTTIGDLVAALNTQKTGRRTQRASNVLFMNTVVIRSLHAAFPSLDAPTAFFNVPTRADVFSAADGVFYKCAMADKLLAPLVLIRSAGMALAYLLFGFSDAAGSTYVTKPGSQSVSHPGTSMVEESIFFYSGALVHSPQNMCRAPFAHLKPAVCGMGVTLSKANTLAGMAEELNKVVLTNPWSAAVEDNTEDLMVDLIPISVKRGVDTMSKLRWHPKESVTNTAGALTVSQIVPNTTASDKASVFVSYVLAKLGVAPNRKDWEGHEDSEAPASHSGMHRLPFCATRVLNARNRFEFTIFPEAFSLMHDTDRVASYPGMHPFGSMLRPGDIFGNSGYPGSSGIENAHARLISSTELDF